jgi:hypothetical protein
MVCTLGHSPSAVPLALRKRQKYGVLRVPSAQLGENVTHAWSALMLLIARKWGWSDLTTGRRDVTPD